MLDQYFEQVRKPDQEINPVLKFLGVRVERIDKDKVVFALPIRDEFRHAGGFVAGGLLATLADEAMGHVAAANLEPEEGAATIEMNVRYLKTIKSGEARAEAVVVKKGRNVVTVEAEVKNQHGAVLCTAGASFIVFDAMAFLRAQAKKNGQDSLK